MPSPARSATNPFNMFLVLVLLSLAPRYVKPGAFIAPGGAGGPGSTPPAPQEHAATGPQPVEAPAPSVPGGISPHSGDASINPEPAADMDNKAHGQDKPGQPGDLITADTKIETPPATLPADRV